MTTDLFYLALTAGLGIIMWIPPVAAQILAHGPPGAGDYGNVPEKALPDWGRRANRAHLNLVENLAVFAALVLIAHVAGKANAVTATWCAVFFWARIAHAVVMYGGIPYVRTLIYVLGVVAEIVIFVEIVA